MLYPVDGDSGGSWIAARNNGDAAVLLNGGFVRHQPQDAYRKSRGKVFLELIGAVHPVHYFLSTYLEGIAPFTVIFYVNRQLIECRWDGAQKHKASLSPRKPYIWSSVTLYDPETIREREDWFRQWLQTNPPRDTESIFSFHRFGGKGDIENDFVMNRQDRLFTVSITSIHLQPRIATMTYFDMRNNRAYKGSMEIKKGGQLYQRIVNRLKKAAIITTHWEYWPFHFVYTPVYWYWLWLSIKARSFFFFSEANPGIEYAGFTHERKSGIYALLPPAYYPKTVLCRAETSLEDILLMLAGKPISYPMIAKPDIGERGNRVKLLHSNDDLEQYRASTRVDFLLQEFINYEQEVGIFYYRIPGEEKGFVSGVVGKDFLGVTGDGSTTIEGLVRKNDRFFLQLAVLKQEYGDFLNTVPPPGEYVELVPYGNHARGARFLDLSHRITDQLTESIDRFCQQVPGFYFGRLDIKFRSWEDLYQGRHFSVIELNGAGSEPTHIYDPAHSIFFAWKEIIRHWRLLYRISRLNAKANGKRFMTTGEGVKILKMHRLYMQKLTNVDSSPA